MSVSPLAAGSVALLPVVPAARELLRDLLKTHEYTVWLDEPGLRVPM
ncbi:hypothetical protein [Microcoleus sp. FACHB-68]|nr:hypothetical protein [Microcoleus sp. FACHB-68]MBD1938451.1 hypothetical protein [Microcoleus sp. FACHB-68]